MINAERYEQIILELKENLEDKEKTQKLIEELSKTRDVYKKSLVCDNYIKVGKLTTRGEILLDDPIHPTLDNSKPINHYSPGWYIKYKYDNDYTLIDKFPVKRMEEVSISKDRIIGYRLPINEPSIEVSTIVFYDQYHTGDEKAAIVPSNYHNEITILMPDGSRTIIPLRPL